MTTADGGPRSPLPARDPMVAHQRPQCTHKSQGRESHRGYPRGYTRWVTTWSSIRRGPIGSRTEKRASLSNRTPPSQWVRRVKTVKARGSDNQMKEPETLAGSRAPTERNIMQSKAESHNLKKKSSSKKKEWKHCRIAYGFRHYRNYERKEPDGA